MPTRPPVIPITGDDAADRLLEQEPLALLIGMLLDQQVPMEWAFKGPYTLRDRLGGRLDAGEIAGMDQDAFVDVCCEKPAIHRFPAAMARRTHELCQILVDDYDGDAAKIWKGVRSAQVLHDRLRQLPGYGEEKTKIFMAILAKRFDRRPAGWEEVAAPFSDAQPRSVADVFSEESLQQVRAWKKKMKAEKKSKQDMPA
ncbi:HhH-GPD-type base excision DNA repair protein [soil metagenome]